MRRVIMLLVIAFALAPSGAGAHAFLDHAAPAVGSTLRAAPTEVSIWFTQQLEPAFSGAEVADGTGKRVDTGSTRVDAADATLLHVALPPLPPGTYRVHWHVLSVDTHRTEGNFNFTIAP